MSTDEWQKLHVQHERRETTATRRSSLAAAMILAFGTARVNSETRYICLCKHQ